MNGNIIGAGRLGKNIVLALLNAQMMKLDSICNTTLESSIKACQQIGFGTAVSTLDGLTKADVTWITCNDDAIESVVRYLAQHPILKTGSLVIHCSGALNSTLLSPLKDQGCFIASFHPLKAFGSDKLDPEVFNLVDCVLEGDSKACDWIKQSFEQLGANIITSQPETKIIYHAGACIASNYLVTLASYSEALLLQAGINKNQTRTMICNLMQSNLNNMRQTELIADNLTGPLMRGDIQTLNMHLQSIENPEIIQLYKALGLATLALTSLTEEKKDTIKKMFEK